jgi:hypothetical protein
VDDDNDEVLLMIEGRGSATRDDDNDNGDTYAAFAVVDAARADADCICALARDDANVSDGISVI